MGESYFSSFRTARRVDTVQAIQIASVLYRLIASLSLAVAYIPKFREPVSGELELKANSSGSEAESGNTTNELANGGNIEEDDEDEDDGAKKKTPYDWPVVLLRIRRILPLVVPRQSRLAYGLISKHRPMHLFARWLIEKQVVCIALQLLTNVAELLQPRQVGLIVNDLAEGRAPWHK